MEGYWKLLWEGGGGGGYLKAKFLEEKYKAKLEFPGVEGGGLRGCKTKKLLWGNGYFLELHNFVISAAFYLFHDKCSCSNNNPAPEFTSP